MSYSNNFNNGPGKNASTYGSPYPNHQTDVPTKPKMNLYQARTPVVYSPSVSLRNQVTDSESMSEYTEVQMVPKRPICQTNPPNSSPYFPSRESVMRSQINSYHRMGEITPPGGQYSRKDTFPHTLASHAATTRATPYTRPPYTPQPQIPLQLCPLPSPKLFANAYNPDQSFVIQSTSSSPANWNSSSDFRKQLGNGLAKTNTNIPKPATEASKVSSVSCNRFLIGSIGQVVRWNKLARAADIHAVYEVSALLDSVYCNSRQKEYNMVLRDDQNRAPPLQGVFYPTDRDFPNIRSGHLVTFVGRMVGTNKLQVFDMWPTDPNSLVGLKRISFLCQRSLQEAGFAVPEP